MVKKRIFSLDYCYVFISYKIYLSNMTSIPGESVESENKEQDNSTLPADCAALAISDEVLHPDTTTNGNSIPDTLSSLSSTNSEENDTMRPFMDSALTKRRRKHVEETWLKEFVLPTSAPQGAYSPIAQAVKRLLPERAACRLGKSFNKLKY